MNVINKALSYCYELIFGCRHPHLTRPFTLEAETYKVCLDCGRQIAYSIEAMAPLSSRQLRQMRSDRVSIAAGALAMMPATAAEREMMTRRGTDSTAAA